MTNKPNLTRVWAKTAPGGNVVDPDTVTAGKFNAGWQAEVPPFEYFNFIQKQVTEGLAHINEQGIAVWDEVTTYPVGGLAKGSDGNVYKTLVSQNGNDPVSDNGTNWKVFGEDSNLTYDSGTSYTAGDIATSSTAIYLSITSANINNDPDIDNGTNWDRVLTFSGVGTNIGDLVELEDVDGTPGLPAVDGSQLLNIPAAAGKISGLEIRTSQSRGAVVMEVSKGFATDEAGLVDIPLSGGAFVDASVSGESGIYAANRDADTWYAIYLLKKTDDSVTVMAVHQDTPVWAFSSSYSAIRLIAWARLDSTLTPVWRPIDSYENGSQLVTVLQETGSSGARVVTAANPADDSWNRVALYKFIPPGVSNFVTGQVAQQKTKGGTVSLRQRPMGSQLIQLDPSYLFINSGPEASISSAQSVDIVLAGSAQLEASFINGVRTLEWSSRYGDEASSVFIDIIRYGSNRTPPSDWNQFKRDDYPFRDSKFVRMFQEAGTFYMYGFKFTGTGSATFDDIYLWTSTDGVSWTEVGVILSAGGVGDWDESLVWSLNVVKVGTGDYRALYTGRNSAGDNQIGYATASSPDGAWTKFVSNPVISPAETWEGGDVEIGSILVDSGTVYAWYHQVSSSPRQSGLATSSDWETWTKDAANPIFQGSATDEFTESQQFSPGVFKYNGLYYNVISSYNGTTKGSTDGIMVLYRDNSPTFYPNERERIGVISTVSQKWEEGGLRGIYDTFRVVVDGDYSGETVPYISSGRMWAPYSAVDGGNDKWACGMMNIPIKVFE